MIFEKSIEFELEHSEVIMISFMTLAKVLHGRRKGKINLGMGSMFEPGELVNVEEKSMPEMLYLTVDFRNDFQSTAYEFDTLELYKYYGTTLCFIRLRPELAKLYSEFEERLAEKDHREELRWAYEKSLEDSDW